MKTIAKTLLLALIVFCFAASASAATFNVNTTADTQDANAGDGFCADSGGACSFRAALTETNALPGEDVINLPAGVFTQTLVAANEDANAGGDWDINSPGPENNGVTINGAGIDSTILQAAAAPDTASERVLDSLTLGNAALGGRVDIYGVTIRHGRQAGFEDSPAGQGGGIRNLGDFRLTNAKVTQNKASNSGGIRNEKVIILDGVSVELNTCAAVFICRGGGMYNALGNNSGIIIKNSSFTGNSATATSDPGFAFGGGFGVESTNSSYIRIENSVFAGNSTASNGVQGGTLGAGLFFGAGGSNMQIEIAGAAVTGNSGTGIGYHIGSGIYIGTVSTGSVSGHIDHVSSKQNEGSYGTGIAFFGRGGTIQLNLYHSSLSGNTALNGAGAGIFSDSTNPAAHVSINMLNNTVSGNSSAVNGGGIHVNQLSSGTAHLIANFCTVTNNSAAFSSDGTTGGGGIYNGAGAVDLKNSVVSGNFTGQGTLSPDILGTINSLDYNHIGITSGAVFTGTTTHNTTGNALLGPLANNGGPTLTHLPAFGSPLVNSIPSGTSDCATLIPSDQRNTSRPQGAGCDRGSVERMAYAAGPWSLSGVVKTTTGQPIRNVAVTISGGALPAPITVFTGNFGTYQFTNLTGEEYTVSVLIKRYRFSEPSRTIAVGSNITDADFIAVAPFSREAK